METNSKKTVVTKGWGRERCPGRAQRIFRAVRTLYDTTMMGTLHYTLSNSRH